MGEGKNDEQYSEAEAARRRDEALRRALNTPPKPRGPQASDKTRPASKGRVRKGKSRA